MMLLGDGKQRLRIAAVYRQLCPEIEICLVNAGGEVSQPAIYVPASWVPIVVAALQLEGTAALQKESEIAALQKERDTAT